MMAEATVKEKEATVKEKQEATRFKKWIFPLGLLTVFLSALVLGKDVGTTAEKIINNLELKPLVSNAKYLFQAGVGTLVTVILDKLKILAWLGNIIWKPKK